MRGLYQVTVTKTRNVLVHRIGEVTKLVSSSTCEAAARRAKATLSPFKHCRVTLKILPERQFRLNETSNHFIQGEGGGRGRERPLAVSMNQHTAWAHTLLRSVSEGYRPIQGPYLGLGGQYLVR